jgi:acetyl-CoA C-acetyltransferase
MRDAYLYDGLRTPVGRYGGALSTIRPDDLAAGVIRALLDRSPFAAAQIEEVILGCACQAGEDARNISRHAALLADLPIEIGGVTVNRLCGSGMSAVIDGCRAVAVGDGDLFVVGGVESMTRAPLVLAKAASAFGRDQSLYDTTIGTRFPNPRLVAAQGNDSMPETAENIAREMELSRDLADHFALGSQQKYARAKAAGIFSEEIAAVEIGCDGTRAPVTMAEDEHPRADSSLEGLAKLKPLAPGGVVTAGNSSGINDGAVALLVGNQAIGKAVGAKPLAVLRSAAVAGVSPRLMGLGPVPASAKALARAGLALRDMDVIELNEAFAAQVLGCCRGLGLDPKDSRLNPNGGAIAIGHPLGASGARLVLTAARQLQRSQGRFALATLCIGVGQGIAVVLERV